MRYRFAVFIGLPFFFYCASTQNGNSQQVTTASDVKVVEDFDPGTLGDYRLPADTSEDKADVFDIDKFLKGKQAAEFGDAKQVAGYRIQLASTRNEQEARIVKQEALLKFDEKVYTAFDNPYYKVRIGNCVSRLEAESLQQKAIEEGFIDAWVVRTMVLPALKEEQNE